MVVNLNKTEKAFITFCKKYPVCDSHIEFYDNASDNMYFATFENMEGATRIIITKRKIKDGNRETIYCEVFK